MINEYLNSKYTLLPLNYNKTIPDSLKICSDLNINFSDLEPIYKGMVEEKINHINSLCLEEKFKYLNITNDKELLDFEKDVKHRFYLNERDYDDGFNTLQKPTEIILEPTIISNNKIIYDPQKPKIIKKKVVKEITKKPKVKKEIEKENNKIEKEIEKEIKIEKEVVILHPKVVNEITTQLKHFDKHYNIMFPCNCDKLTEAKEYNRQKKNKSNLRTEYKKYINGTSLRDCKDNSKLTMMIYILDNIPN